MATFIRREKTTTAANFNNLTEINFWAKRLEVTPEEFKKIFTACGQSISATIAECNRLRA
jgi:hypothetical protein